MKTSTHFKKNLLAGLIGASIVSLAAMPGTSFAQSAYATLRGKAPPDTHITATNPATGSARQTLSASDGSYTLTGLQPNTWQIDAGPGTQKTVTLTVASTSTLNFAAANTSTSTPANAVNLSGVTVTASTLTDVTTPEVGATISLHQIDTIPQISRNFLEFADTVPGMVFSVNAQGNTSLRGGAQNDASTNVYIDGVGQKSYLFGAPPARTPARATRSRSWRSANTR